MGKEITSREIVELDMQSKISNNQLDKIKRIIDKILNRDDGENKKNGN